MPYFPLENLEDQHDVKRITEKERPSDFFFHVPDALKFLHYHKVVHPDLKLTNIPVESRDLKPANMLIESHDPSFVKLAEFGFAKDSSDLKKSADHIYIWRLRSIEVKNKRPLWTCGRWKPFYSITDTALLAKWSRRAEENIRVRVQG